MSAILLFELNASFDYNRKTAPKRMKRCHSVLSRFVANPRQVQVQKSRISMWSAPA